MARVDLHALEQHCARALAASGASLANAGPVARALVAAEADGLGSHGVARVPGYCAQVRSGKVDGRAEPRLSNLRPGALRVDARSGFAAPALEVAVEGLVRALGTSAIAAAAVARSHHCGAAGYFAEQLANEGLLGLLFSNTPRAIAPWGGSRALFGTNPIAFAAPRSGHPPLVVDLSLSRAARGKVMLAARSGAPIPEGWAVDARGRPTTDAAAALAGSMLPLGDAKGSALVLAVEVLAAALTASNFGYEASSFFDKQGPPPHVGQFLIAIDPEVFSAGAFGARLEDLVAAIESQTGARLPGARRLADRELAASEGVDVDDTLLSEIEALAGG